VFRRRWNEPRREGQYKVIRAMPTGIKVEGSTTWYHLNHCTRAATRRGAREHHEEGLYVKASGTDKLYQNSQSLSDQEPCGQKQQPQQHKEGSIETEGDTESALAVLRAIANSPSYRNDPGENRRSDLSTRPGTIRNDEQCTLTTMISEAKLCTVALQKMYCRSYAQLLAYH